jgi:hypothetical protein
MRFSMNPIFDFIFAMFAEKLIVLVRKGNNKITEHRRVIAFSPYETVLWKSRTLTPPYPLWVISVYNFIHIRTLIVSTDSRNQALQLR